MLYRLAFILTKKSFTILFLVLYVYLVPHLDHLNLNKTLEHILETPCKYFLTSKSSFNSLYTLNLLFLHIPECILLITKFLNALFIQEPSEVEVKSISLIIPRTHFSTAFSLYLEIKNYYILFQKPSYKKYLSFFQ